MLSVCLFCLSNSQKSKDIQFIVIYHEKRILTILSLEAENVGHFCLQYDI